MAFQLFTGATVLSAASSPKAEKRREDTGELGGEGTGSQGQTVGADLLFRRRIYAHECLTLATFNSIASASLVT